MENQNFVCPHCSKKQQIKKLLLLSNFSKWNCPYCETEIAPEKKALYTELYMEFLVRFLPLFQQIIVYTC